MQTVQDSCWRPGPGSFFSCVNLFTVICKNNEKQSKRLKLICINDIISRFMALIKDGSSFVGLVFYKRKGD